MARSKSKPKSKSKAKAKTSQGQPKAKSTFVLNACHKRFLTGHADQHAEARPEDKAAVIVRAVEELLKEYSITRKEDIVKARKVVKAWFYDRNDRGETVIPITKYGFLKEMTAQRIWCYERKSDITETVQSIIPGGPSDPLWIGEFSHQSTVLWKEACKTSGVLEEYEEKAEKFREGQASIETKASYGDFCFADFCRAVVGFAWKRFNATTVIMTCRPTHTTPLKNDIFTVYDKDPENPHRITFTDTYPQNWSCNDFVSFMRGSNPPNDGISLKAFVVFHRSGEPMLPEWNSQTTVKVKRDILLHFLRISYVMATGIPSARPPYKKIIDGNICDYITADYLPGMVQDEVFLFRKPGEIKVAHLDAWLNLLQARQERFLRREVDQIFRYARISVEGTILKPARYNQDFMKSYALEHGPLYTPAASHTTSQPTNTVSDAVDGTQMSASQQRPPQVSEEESGIRPRSEVEQDQNEERSESPNSEETQRVAFEPEDDRSAMGTVSQVTLHEDNRLGEGTVSQETVVDVDDEEQVDNYLGHEDNDSLPYSADQAIDDVINTTEPLQSVEQETSNSEPDVDELELALQDLEALKSSTQVNDRNAPRWAGTVRSRRLEFLANLCQNSCYQDILARLRELPYVETNPERTHCLEWSDWSSEMTHLPREVHLERTAMLKFIGFLSSWKKNIATMITDPLNLERFLLTIGLAYRDMSIIHADHHLTSPQQTLPDFMSAASLLTPRVKEACDSVLRLVSEEIKLHPLNPPPERTDPASTSGVESAGHGPTKKSGKNSRSKDISGPVKTIRSQGSVQQTPETRLEERPIILPRVKPRKRKRDQFEEGIDEDTMFIVKRARMQPEGSQPTGTRKSARGHIPKKVDNDFQPTVPVMNRRNKG